MKKKIKILLAISFFILCLVFIFTLAGGNLMGMIRPIATFSPQIITRPVTQIKYENIVTSKKTYCNKKNFKVAFVLLYQNDSQLTDVAKTKMKAIKDELAGAFKVATGNLASLDIDAEIYTLKVDKNLFIGDSSDYADEIQTYGAIIKQFYSNHADIYDQLVLGLTWGGTSTNWHIIIKNDILGIGLDNVPDHSQLYGTKNLYGYSQIPNLNTLVYPADGLYVNTLMHEIGHQWCCYAGDNFSGIGEPGKVEIKQDYYHFYQGLASPYETRTLMTAKKWLPNGDGTYRADFSLESTHTIKKYHPFMLYYMGLLSADQYGVKHDIYNAGPDDPNNLAESFNYDSATFYNQVSVNDIIARMGERKCK